jgi:phospholipid/cholesterol/gamma-HCH transport system substrate-binding protein
VSSPTPPVLATWTKVTSILVVVALALTAFVVFRAQDDVKTVSAHFPRTISLFEGNEVRILGVPVGEITTIVPEGNSVRVDMEYDAEYDVPAGAKAAIVTPTLVADRFVQLTPAYSGGPVMEDGADIPLADTAVPVELDQVYEGLDSLSVALGPNGVNADGSLSELLSVSADTLDGQGARVNEMIGDLARTVDTFNRGRGDLFGTVRGLQRFTTHLAANDRQVRDFIVLLADVSDQLAGERQEIRRALSALAVALGTVERFVRENKGLVERDVAALADVSGVMAKHHRILGTLLEKAPTGLHNLILAFDTVSGAIGSRIHMSPSVDDIDGLACHWVRTADVPDEEQACRLLTRLLRPLQPVFDGVADGIDGRGGLPVNPGGRPGGDQSLRGLLGGRR